MLFHYVQRTACDRKRAVTRQTLNADEETALNGRRTIAMYDSDTAMMILLA